MIPISKDFRLFKVFEGITYSFLPPTGEIEIFLLTSTETVNLTKAVISLAYNKAETFLEKDYKGRKKPVKKKWLELMDEKMADFLPDDNIKEKLFIIMETIDKILVGWKGCDATFPDDGKPSSCLRINLMKEMYEWYWGEYTLTEKELKN